MDDALGNKIVIGDYYGYSGSSNGYNTIHIGQAVRLTKMNLLRLSVEITKTGHYEDIKNSIVPAGGVAIKPCTVFPVDINIINREDPID